MKIWGIFREYLGKNWYIESSWKNWYGKFPYCTIGRRGDLGSERKREACGKPLFLWKITLLWIMRPNLGYPVCSGSPVPAWTALPDWGCWHLHIEPSRQSCPCRGVAIRQPVYFRQCCRQSAARVECFSVAVVSSLIPRPLQVALTVWTRIVFVWDDDAPAWTLTPSLEL